jgi:serine/threonine-protein kinase HipA
MIEDRLEVWIDAALTGSKPILVGYLYNSRGNIRFQYADDWLKQPFRFMIDPSLSLSDQPFHPNPTQGNFGIFLDSSPDRWGQTLMKRRESLEAQENNRPAKTLYAWDFLIGVQDQTRQGALRFKYPQTDTFLSDHPLSAPPVAQLRELELSVLVAPGASLGGARPKANFTDQDGSLWIAKFPAKDDEIDIAAWEMVAYELAKDCGIHLPLGKLFLLNAHHHTFAVKRFDRENKQRIHYASAMTLLNKSDSENSFYIDIAYFINTKGAAKNIKRDLTQLFHRVIFNWLISNHDDHLRNHGFLLSKNGWELSPAFDVNPNIDKQDHVLKLLEDDSPPSLEGILATSPYYDLTKDEAYQIYLKIQAIVNAWEQYARKIKISRADIEIMRPAFISN